MLGHSQHNMPENPAVYVTLTSSDYAELRARADELGLTLAAYVRMLTRRHLADDVVVETVATS
jgi:hypothetical protein